MEQKTPPLSSIKQQMFLHHVDKETKKIAYLKRKFKEQGLIIEMCPTHTLLGTSERVYICGNTLWLNHIEHCKTFTHLPIHENIKIFSASGNRILLVTQEEKLYLYGQKAVIGPTNKLSQTTRQLIGASTKIRQVATSWNSSAYLTEHEVFIAGGYFFKKTLDVPENISEIGLGEDHYVVLTEIGVYTRGNNEYGQLGLGDNTNRDFFSKVDLNAQQIAAGPCYTLAAVGKHIYACGENDCGQLGLGDKKNRSSFISIFHLEGNIEQIGAGSKHSAAVVDNTVLLWGDNTYGQLGLGDNQPRLTPQKAELPGKILILKMHRESTLVVTSEGIYFAGRNDYYQFGNGDNDNHNTFTKMNNLPAEIQQIYNEANKLSSQDFGMEMDEMDMDYDNNNNNNN